MITIGLEGAKFFNINSNVELKSLTRKNDDFSYTITLVHKFISAN